LWVTGAVTSVLSEEPIKLAAGRVERALLFVRTVMRDGTSVFMDSIAEKPVRRHFLRDGS
jgi:hypothetical protein